jgi:hypothetical protein
MVFIDAFLDAVDVVLNSNTFLITTEIRSGDIAGELAGFIASDAFLEQMLASDIARGWFNLHESFEQEPPPPKPGKLVRPGFSLNVTKGTVTVETYLVAMLTADARVGSFVSFYNRRKTPDEARALARNLIACLCGNKHPDLYILKPDFLADATAGPDDIYYFEGPMGACDSAAAIVCGTMAYLLLTNGTS